MQGQPVTVEIIDLTHEGEGVADLAGQRIFVPGVLPGERALVAARLRRRRHAQGELLEVLRPSPERVEPGCEYFGLCGGCSLQHLAYERQIEAKERDARETLRRIGGIEAGAWLPRIMGRSWGYRRRARLGVKYVEAKGRVLVGFRERRAPLVMDMAHCPILVPPFDRLLGELAATIGAMTIRQRVPQAEVTAGDETAALVLRVLDAPGEEDCNRLLALGQRFDIDIYLQSGGPGTVVPLLPAAARPLSYGLQPFDLRLEFGPTDFIQVNADVNVQMVASVVEQLDVQPDDRVLDLFCGIGNFSLPLATRAREVLGVEGEAQLVARAVANAQRNHRANATFLTADLSQSGWGFLREPWDLIVLDPPRTGAEAVVEQIAQMGPRRIAYVSCHPGSLARDAKALAARGYRLSEARALDMFPHTHHVELTAMFDRI
jgi:23S rRNA (uracil1939-C5)-methyltransferase